MSSISMTKMALRFQFLTGPTMQFKSKSLTRCNNTKEEKMVNVNKVTIFWEVGPRIV